jgi:hypothetical protein
LLQKEISDDPAFCLKNILWTNAFIFHYQAHKQCTLSRYRYTTAGFAAFYVMAEAKQGSILKNVSRMFLCFDQTAKVSLAYWRHDARLR